MALCNPYDFVTDTKTRANEIQNTKKINKNKNVAAYRLDAIARCDSITLNGMQKYVELFIWKFWRYYLGNGWSVSLNGGIGLRFVSKQISHIE